MSSNTSAETRFPRIIELIARIRGQGPQRMSELARTLDMTEAELRADVNELLGRIYYRPGGWVEDIPVYLEGDTLEIPRASAFGRPIRLSPPESLCVMLALRTAVAQSFQDDPDSLEPLLAATEQYLAGSTWNPDTLETVLAADFAPDAVGIRQTLIRSARERAPCTITYLKPGQPEAEARTIHPWALVHANGAWHSIGWCTLREAVRQFRVDRILDAVQEPGAFTIPEGFDATTELPSLLLQQDESATTVRVRYDASAALWVREDAHRRGFTAEDQPDGQVEIVHRVGDVAWLVHHILSVAPAAEVVEPREVRALVADLAEGLGGGRLC
jgi:predicted DNA-binding transcriptional regulator YafY